MTVRPRRPRMLLAVAALATVTTIGPGASRAEEAVMNPHLRENCLRCHKGDPKQPEPGRTRIFSSREEPHAAVAGSCRSCHSEARTDFWLLILPAAGGGEAAPPAFAPGPGVPVPGSAAAGPPAAPAPGAAPAVAPAKAPAVAPAKVAAAAPASTPASGVEGFENSHDAMGCTGCHDKPAEQLKPGAPPPPRFASQGADIFCRSCHSGVDRTHFPRGNTPASVTTCLSCHRVHGRSLLYPSLRDDFPKFLADSAALNPHGGRIFCLACHPDTPQAGAPVVLRFPDDSLRLCQRCHSGVEHHPLKVKSSQETWKMDFSHTPLENEGIVCISCHKPLECRGATGRENPRFLRGGPFNSGEEFCQRCHEDKKLSTLDPHDQIDETGVVYRKKCLYCHVSVPDVNEGGDGLRYTDTLTALCTSCHQIGAHPAQEHLLRMSREKLSNLREYEEQRQVRLPLEDDTKVTCVTCHNPHERGLLKGPAGIGADEDKRLRLTTYSEQCLPCHERH